MKRLLLAIVAVVTLTTVAWAHEYVPMVREGVKWVYVTKPGQRYPQDYNPTKTYDYTTVTYELRGDTLIGDISFKKCWRTIDTPYENYFYDDTPQVVAYLYEADKQVWALFPTAISKNIRGLMGYIPYTLEEVSNMNIFRNVDRATKLRLRLLYDFNDVGAFLKNIPRKYYPQLDAMDPYFEVTETDITESTDGNQHLRYHLKAVRPNSENASRAYEDTKHMARVFDDGYIVESFGFIYTPQSSVWGEASSFLSPSGEYIYGEVKREYTSFFDTYFSHVELNGQIEYKGPTYNYAQFLLKGSPDGIEVLKAGDIDDDSQIFDLQGRVVTGTPAPGIYVKQGKKVVVE